MINYDEQFFDPTCDCDRCNWLERLPKEEAFTQLIAAIGKAGFSLHAAVMPSLEDGKDGHVTLSLIPHKKNSVADDLFKRQQENAKSMSESFAEKVQEMMSGGMADPTKPKKKKPRPS